MTVPPVTPNRLPVTGEWRRRGKGKRHECAAYAPTVVPDDIEYGDRWRCPSCRRRWQVSPCRDELGLSMRPIEGVYWRGRDGSVYWRPYRARFIGHPFGS